MMNEGMGGGSLFDSLFGEGSMGGMSDFGIADSPSEEQRKKAKRQGTIIDVEVERDD
jgi:hypothetical protein